MVKIDYSVVPVELTDLPIISKFIYDSNLQQATNRFLFYDWPNEPVQMEMYLNGMEPTFKNPNNQIFKVVDNSNKDTIASYILANHTVDNHNITESQESKPSKIPFGVNLEFRSLLRQAVEDVQKGMKEVDHLSMLCISML